jgi:hypothetical protein
MINEFHSDSSDVGYTAPIIKHAIYFSLLPWHVSIFFKVTLYFWNSFVNAAARFHVGLHLFLLVFNHIWLPYNYLRIVL